MADRRRQRVIGVLGGMSWESTAQYYALLNRGVAERLGGLHSAELVVRSVDFAPIEEMQVAGEWDRAGEVLADAAADLAAAGAEAVVLATNTMHLVADEIERRARIPLLHIGDATAAAVEATGRDRVGFLGTGFTMEHDFMLDRLRRHGLEVEVPDADDRALVHRVIYEELCLGLVSPGSRDAYLEVVRRLVDRGCEGVVLGCTEIELLLDMADAHGVPLFPTTRIHAEAAVDWALS